jgi:hypothetical protein
MFNARLDVLVSHRTSREKQVERIHGLPQRLEACLDFRPGYAWERVLARISDCIKVSVRNGAIPEAAHGFTLCSELFKQILHLCQEIWPAALTHCFDQLGHTEVFVPTGLGRIRKPTEGQNHIVKKHILKNAKSCAAGLVQQGDPVATAPKQLSVYLPTKMKPDHFFVQVGPYFLQCIRNAGSLLSHLLASPDCGSCILLTTPFGRAPVGLTGLGLPVSTFAFSLAAQPTGHPAVMRFYVGTAPHVMTRSA